MPKVSKDYCVIDECVTISTGYLSKYGFFKTDVNLQGEIIYTGDTKLVLNIKTEHPNSTLIFSYLDKTGTRITQRIKTVSIPSNLGKGLIRFFICPYTFKRCRNLIFINNRFMHRTNLLHPHYRIQTESKKWRTLFSLCPNRKKLNRFLGETNQSNYKKTYAGKPTKRYLKWLSEFYRIESNQNKYESLLFKNLK